MARTKRTPRFKTTIKTTNINKNSKERGRNIVEIGISTNLSNTKESNTRETITKGANSEESNTKTRTKETNIKGNSTNPNSFKVNPLNNIKNSNTKEKNPKKKSARNFNPINEKNRINLKNIMKMCNSKSRKAN
jgi:hypothetical protein